MLVGHSWGGVVACHVAARAADAVGGLVLLDAGHVDYPDQVPPGIGSDDQVAGFVDGGGHDLLADAGPAVARAVDAWLLRSVS